MTKKKTYCATFFLVIVSLFAFSLTMYSKGIVAGTNDIKADKIDRLANEKGRFFYNVYAKGMRFKTNVSWSLDFPDGADVFVRYPVAQKTGWWDENKDTEAMICAVGKKEQCYKAEKR
jgi:hypothetical protein